MAAALLVALLGFGFSPAEAQMQLPGAVGGGSSGPQASGGAAPAPPPKPVAIEAPVEAAVAGHALAHDGAQGEMTLERGGDKAGGLALAKLALVGEKVSKPGQSCKVEVALPSPLPLVADGRPAGALRFGVPVKECPFNVDVLEGAVLVTGTEPTCTFVADDCKVSPGGLWGPKAAEITAKQTQELERSRVRLETAMRANFHALLHKAGKDRATVKAIAAQQAAFSSEREMTCRDYADEARHGFCSTQITEARALALLAQFGPVKQSERRFPSRAKPKAAASSDTE